MDEQVLAAMARWPDVPAAYGWLSLSRRGQWLLHPHGQGWGAPDEEPGETITNPQIAAFMNRNYQSDGQGRWFFQNGPQRVYVRLDGAPWILHTPPDTRGPLQLRTHAGQPYGPITHWWLDDEGCLYAQSDQGAGLVADRDLAQVIEALRTEDGQPVGAWLEAGPGAPGADAIIKVHAIDPGAENPVSAGPGAGASPQAPAPFGRLRAADAGAALGFIRRPAAASTDTTG
ncbi:DUF2946 family protein [Castellaniella sp.]|uniref:DUF2946 family protein n=1 Tax=Castellaniella sp. TaxID=1955812 RepID=UPI003C73025F